MTRPHSLLLALVACGLILLSTTGSHAGPLDYDREVKPILAEHCFQCHGPDAERREAGLRLDTREGATAKLDSEAVAIVSGDWSRSELGRRVLSTSDDEVMPPPSTKRKLTPKQIKVLEQWVKEGAPYSAGHWAFAPPRQAAPPENKIAGALVHNPIDNFVLDRVHAAGLSPAPQAAPETLCRRMYLDVIGLPPSPREVETFVASYHQHPTEAISKLIDQLLKRNEYGEKWARVWLDVARYSDSNGYEKDLPREQWAWRDWVVAAYNRDLPYNQFLIEQIAGDMLPNASQEQVVATGFLRNGMINEEGAVVPEQFRLDGMFDRLDCVGKAVLGLSLQCCQCHSHKFDPLSQEEYYGLFAFLNDAFDAQTWVYTAEQQQQIRKVRDAIAATEAKLKQERPNWAMELAAWEAELTRQQIAWTPLVPLDMDSTGGLNHPTALADHSVLTLGHPTTRGDIFIVGEPELKGTTALRFEVLTHGDLPFNGPGRSRYGTWAISEMEVSWKKPDAKNWERLKLTDATADFSEPEGPLEEEWKADFDPQRKRTRGHVKNMIDGDNNTGWRADRGWGRRNQPSVAVVRFDKPLDAPAGTQLRVLLRFDHGDSSNGRGNVMVGRCRVSTTSASDAKTPPVDYAAQLAVETPSDQRSPEQQAAIFTAWRTSSADCQKYNEEIEKHWKEYPVAATSVLSLAARSTEFQRPTHLLDRGAWDRPKHLVSAHVPAALHPLSAASPNRLAFARWLADDRSPLAARVAVNRAWQSIFGIGLVETSEDFGTRTPVPEHQQLLDWLAVDFMQHQWSQKHLIRTILSSATYQQTSQLTPLLLERDPGNRLLARGPRFRVDAETVRDLALSCAGKLHQQLGGPSIFPPVPPSVLDYNYTKPTYWNVPTDAQRYRRSLYLFRKRSMPDPVLSAFDAPNGDFACARRPRSNTPLAALTSLNETIFLEAAQGLALRVLREAGSTDAERIQFAYRICTARQPTTAELEAVSKTLHDQRVRLAAGQLKAHEIGFSSLAKLSDLPAHVTPNEVAAWTLISRVLLNLDETLTKN